MVDGEERLRLAGHLAMLPGSPTAVRPAARGSAAPFRLGVVRDLFVRILQAFDQLLDAEIVGQELCGNWKIAAEYVMERGIEEDHGATAEGTVRAAGLEKQDRRRGQAAQLNLASCLLDEVVAVLIRAALHLDQVRMLSVVVAVEPVTRNRTNPPHPRM